jgi:histone H3/H4
MELALASIKRVIKSAVGTDTPVGAGAIVLMAEEVEKFIQSKAIEAKKLAIHAGRKGISEEDVKLVFQ